MKDRKIVVLKVPKNFSLESRSQFSVKAAVEKVDSTRICSQLCLFDVGVLRINSWTYEGQRCLCALTHEKYCLPEQFEVHNGELEDYKIMPRDFLFIEYDMLSREKNCTQLLIIF